LGFSVRLLRGARQIRFNQTWQVQGVITTQKFKLAMIVACSGETTGIKPINRKYYYDFIK